MKQNKTIIFTVALMLAACLATKQSAYAEGKAPGEGAYLGAFMGMGMGILQTKVSSFATTSDNGRTNSAQTYESERGGLGLSGIQGGGWAGYGFKTADDLYFGAELTALASDEKIELTSTNGIKNADGTTENTNTSTITSISATRQWTTGGALRVGYYVNADTLFALKGGVAISGFDVDIGSSNEDYIAGGPQVGGSIETRLSKIDPNLSLRMEFVYTDYLTADILGQANVGHAGGGTGYDAELTGHDTAGRIGVMYSF